MNLVQRAELVVRGVEKRRLAVQRGPRQLRLPAVANRYEPFLVVQPDRWSLDWAIQPGGEEPQRGLAEGHRPDLRMRHRITRQRHRDDAPHGRPTLSDAGRQIGDRLGPVNADPAELWRIPGEGIR